MKNFKKCLVLLLMLALALGVFACTPNHDSEPESDPEESQESVEPAHVFNWGTYKDGELYLNMASKKFTDYVLDDFDHDLYLEKENALMVSAKAGDPLDVFEPIFDEWEAALYDMLSHLTMANTRYYMTGSDEDEKIYKDLEAYQLEYSVFYGELCKVLANAPDDLKKFFYGEYATDEEIADYVKRNAYDNETKDLMDKMSTIENDALELENKNSTGICTDADYIDKTLDLFIEYAALGDKLAKKLNYDNYLEYAYHENFSRDYGPEDVGQSFEWMKKYILPLAKKGCIADTSSWLSNSSLYNFYVGTYENAFTCKRNYYGGYMSDYAVKMGGSFLDAYNHVFEDGFYVFTDNPNSLGTAFTTQMRSEEEGMLFFSSDYQGVSNVIHELGHYIAAYTNEMADNYSFDVLETHSTANEKLFWVYLDTVVSDEVKGQKKDVIHYLAYSFIYNDLATAVVAAMDTEIENYLFANYQTLNKDDLKAGVQDIVDSYKCSFIRDTSWCYPVVASAGYYVSYYVGSLNALQFACQAFEDFDTARDNYLNFMAYTFDEDAGEEFNLDDQLEAGHLYNAFTVDCFTYINSKIYSYEAAE